MKNRTDIVLAIVMSLLSPTGLQAAKFRYGFANTRMDEVSLRIPRPPDALVSKKNVQVQIVEAPPGFGDSNHLRLAVEKALTPDFSMVAAQPDALFKVSVVTFDRPIVKTYTQTESRMIKVGTKASKNRDGTAKVDSKGNQLYEDDIQSRQVPVGYWEARAHLVLRVEVTDSSGITIDGFAPESHYEQKKEISSNNVSSLGGGTLPDERGIQTAMIEDTAQKLVPRYRKTYESEKVALAVDEELRPANAKAIGGNWEGALKDWESTKMKKRDSEGDRIYNIAVAHEALAFRAYEVSDDPKTAEPLFVEALQHYQKAMSLDPGEKYIQRASARIEKAKRNLENAGKQWEAQGFEAEKLKAQMNAKRQADEAERLANEARQRELTSVREDTPEESRFRSMIRLRLKSLGAVPAAEDRARLMTMGRDVYKLDDIKCERVVTQECTRLDKLAASLKTYEESFKDFATDKVITKEERVALVEVGASLSLTSDDVAPIEGGYQFKDLSKVVTPVRAAAPKPAGAKPAAAKPAISANPVPVPAKPPSTIPGVAPPKPATPGVSAPKPALPAPKPGNPTGSGGVPKN